MMKRLCLILLLLIAVFAPFFKCDFSVSEASTSAKSMCVLEANSKRVLNEKNSQQKLAMASTTKIMTAITAIESGVDLDEVFEISNKSVGVPGTSIYLEKGEKMTLRKLLYGLMLVSGNDASVAIGEKIGDGVEHFVDMMNFKAKQIGATNSHFENTHGLDQNGHYTTAYDLALIASYALKNPLFREIVSTKEISISNEDGKVRYFKNKNKLLFNLDGAIGVKTGFTDDAGRCLVSAIEKDDMIIVCVVLNCGPMFEESADLLLEAAKKYKMTNLTQKISLPSSVVVEEGREEEVSIVSEGEFSYPLKDGEEEKIKYEVNLLKSLKAPVEKGEEIGEIKIYLDNELLFSKKIFTMEEIRTKGVLQKFFDLVSEW